MSCSTCKFMEGGEFPMKIDTAKVAPSVHTSKAA